MDGTSAITHSAGLYSARSSNPAALPGPLFDHWSVFWAAFLGSPLAGSVIIAMNYRRLFKPKAAVVAFCAGILVTTAMLLSALTARRVGVPGSASNLLNLIVAFVMASYANGLQGSAIRQSVRAGHRLRSRWAACGIALCCAISILLVVGVMFSIQTFYQKHVIIDNGEIVYSGSATKADASALAGCGKTGKTSYGVNVVSV